MRPKPLLWAAIPLAALLFAAALGLGGHAAAAGPVTPAIGQEVRAVDGWATKSLALSAGRQEARGLDGDYCVYEEAVGEEPTQVKVANVVTGEATLISDPAQDCGAAAIADGYVVYQGYVTADNPEIFLYSIATGRTTRLTTNTYPDRGPRISGGAVTWVASVGPVHDGSDQEIFYYDIAAQKTTRLTDNDAIDSDPRVSGARVAWRSLVDGEMQVYAYDRTSGATTRLSWESTSNREVSVSGDMVAWIGNPPKPPTSWDFLPRVYLYDLEKGRLETVPAEMPAGAAQLFIGTAVLGDGLLAYTWAGDGKEHLTVYDPATAESTEFVDDWLSTPKGVVLSAGLVAWQGSDWHDDEIMVADLETGVVSQLTTNGTNDWHPLTAGRRVVWEDYSQGRAQLMVASTGREPSAPFVDVSGTMRSRSAVVALAEEGVVGGYPTATGAQFRPEAPLLRAQLAKLLVLAFDLPVSEESTCPFRDLGRDDPATLYPNDYVAAAYQAGLIRGTTATTFSPWQTVTRGQAVSVVVRHVLKEYPDSLPWPPAGAYELSDEYPSVHNDNIRVAFYNGLLGGVPTGDGGWNPWFDMKRAEVAQILVNARQHTAPAPRPQKNFFAQGPSLKSLEELNTYLAQEKNLLTELAAQEPDERALARVSFTHPISAPELARLEAAYRLEPTSREAIFEHAGMGGGLMTLSAGDWVRQMQAERLFSVNGPPGADDSPGALVGFTGIETWGPLEALASLQQEEAVVLVDPWKFTKEMRAARRAGIESSAGSYPSVYHAYQKYVAGH